MTHKQFWDSLSPINKQIVFYLPKGKTNPQISSAMGMSTQMVKNHLRSIYHRYGVKSRIEFICFLFANGYVACPCGNKPAEEYVPVYGHPGLYRKKVLKEVAC